MPDGWCWCRLKQLSLDMADGPFGSNLKAEHYTKNKEARIIQLSNIGEYGWREENTKYTTLEYAKNNISRSIVEPGNVVIAKMMPAGRAIICPNNEKMYVLSSDAVKLVPTTLINSNYLLNAINSPFFRASVTDNVQGTTRLRTSISKLRDCFFPLPPLNEQVLIVNAIENAISQIDVLEHNKIDLQNLITQTKSKILDLAIHGKLVPQDPNDEPAEELLKRITTSDNRPYKKFEEDIPFEIPSNWCWCFLGDICSKIKRGKSPKYTDKSTIMAFAQKCNQKDGTTSLEKALYIDESTLKKYPEEEKMQFNDIVINSTGTGTLGRVGIFNCSIPDDVNAVYPDSHVTTVRILPKIDKLYCYYFIKIKQSYLETMGEGSTNQKELKPDSISNLFFPLPSYPEQQRIVSKIDELFSYLDTISSNLE